MRRWWWWLEKGGGVFGIFYIYTSISYPHSPPFPPLLLLPSIHLLHSPTQINPVQPKAHPQSTNPPPKIQKQNQKTMTSPPRPSRPSRFIEGPPLTFPNLQQAPDLLLAILSQMDECEYARNKRRTSTNNNYAEEGSRNRNRRRGDGRRARGWSLSLSSSSRT